MGEVGGGGDETRSTRSWRGMGQNIGEKILEKKERYLFL